MRRETALESSPVWRMSPSVSVRLLLTQSDARLVALASDGHERAFEALVQRYRRPLQRYCRRLLLPNDRAEDALQQALMQAWVALQRGAEVSDVRSWLYRIVHNAALNMLRVSGYDYCTLNESLSGADAPQADLDRRIAVREALAGLAALPQMQREALLRTAVEGASHAQAATDLGITETALRGLVYRARATLRAAATAVTPPPLVAVAVSAGTRSTPFVESFAGAGASGSSAGLAGLLLKGGAVVMTAGTFATGIGIAHRHRKSTKAHARSDATGLLATETTADYATQSSGERPAAPAGRAEPVRRSLSSSAQRGPSTSSAVSDARVISTSQARGGQTPPVPALSQATGDTEPVPAQHTFRHSDAEDGLSSTESQPTPDPQHGDSPAPRSGPHEESGNSVNWRQTHDRAQSESFESNGGGSGSGGQGDGNRGSADGLYGLAENGSSGAPEGKSGTSSARSGSQDGYAEGHSFEQ